MKKNYYLVETDRYNAYPEVKETFGNKRNAIAECKRRNKTRDIANSLYREKNTDRFHIVTSLEVDKDCKILKENVIE